MIRGTLEEYVMVIGSPLKIIMGAEAESYVGIVQVPLKDVAEMRRETVKFV